MGGKRSPPHGETFCPNLAVVCAAVDFPVEGDGHVTSPHGVSAQNNVAMDGVSGAHMDRLI